MIIHANVLDWAREYDGEPFMAMLLDPPYHLTSITKRFGKEGSAPARFGKDGAFSRASAGFMGQAWDGGDIAFDPATWAALSQHLYPGTFIMAFASSRGWHRMAVAMEDSGLILHPTLWNYWSYLSGFPKATRIKGYGSPEFRGHRYGLQALKPSIEPIIVAQVPYEGRPVEDIVATGAGALNIDGGRIGTGDNLNGGAYSGNTPKLVKQIYGEYNKLKPDDFSPPAGRWPSNFILQHSPLDNGECHPDCPVRLFDEQAGETGHTGAAYDPNTNHTHFAGKWEASHTGEHYGDSGPASRMFFQATWQYEVAEQLANAEPVRYEPKVSSTERDTGLDSLETITRHRVNAGGLENEPRFAPTQVKNNHPTLKPISLTKYLATLLLPPAAYAPRRILVPFAGTGSEMIGAILAGWEEVVGIEREENYVKIAEARLSWWSKWPGWGQTDVDKILATKENNEQLSMF